MKKIIIRIAAVVLLIGGIAFNFGLSNTNNNELVGLDMVAKLSVAQANINPKCPNGCVSGNSLCWCYGPYNLREAYWPNN